MASDDHCDRSSVGHVYQPTPRGLLCIYCGQWKHIPPSIYQRGLNYVTAWARWSAAGFPKRDESEVIAIRGLCVACSYFDGSICTHKKCGCNVAKGAWFGDKVSWSTEHCPINKW